MIQKIGIWILLIACIVALCCFFVSVFSERISTIEWWLGNEEDKDRSHGRLAFVRAEWFFYISIGTFAASAIILFALLR
jgi:hypothetical protein